MQIRVAQQEDAGAIDRVLEASYPALMAMAYEPGLLARALPMMTRAQPKLLSSGHYYVAMVESEVVGCGGWSRERPGGTEIVVGLAHIRHFATDPGWVGRGVGRALYERCETEARADGASTFECYSSLNGEPFYAALGFARIGPIEVDMGGGVQLPSILMHRSIL